MDTAERAMIYARYVEEAAAEYRCKPTSMKAKLAATRRLAFENYQARLIDGRDPDPSILKWFLEEEAKHAPPPEPYQLDVTFVRRSHELCPRCKESQPYTCTRCGFEETTEDFERRNVPEPPPQPPPLDGRPAADVAKPTPSGGNVVPLRPAEPAASFHGQYEPWRQSQSVGLDNHVGPVSYDGTNPFHANPIPPGGRSW
jgi:hypothetical protein